MGHIFIRWNDRSRTNITRNNKRRENKKTQLKMKDFLQWKISSLKIHGKYSMYVKEIQNL